MRTTVLQWDYKARCRSPLLSSSLVRWSVWLVFELLLSMVVR